MTGRTQPQLGAMIMLPLATIGVLAAVLVWELEHVGSIVLALVIAASGMVVAIIIFRRLRVGIDELSDYYQSLLHAADEQSERAEAASRSKDAFLGTISHELRTPLNSMLGWTRLLASGQLDDEQTRNAIQAINRAAWAQSRLIEDLLDVSKIVGGKLRLVPRSTVVAPLIDDALQSLAAAAQAKHITIETQADPGMPAIVADPDRLQQIVWNLVSNAIKFTPEGGRVQLSLTTDDRVVCLAVADTGIGFEPGVAAHLFQRFRQADSSTTRPYPGLGLGLGIVRHLVELHGGTVTAESAGENQGSVFRVRIPLERADAAAADRAPAANPPMLQRACVLN